MDFGNSDSRHILSVNGEGTRVLLRAAAAAGVRAFVYTSSCDAVVVDEVPAVMEGVGDTDGGWKHADVRHGVYHTSKVEAELACAAFDPEVSRSLPAHKQKAAVKGLAPSQNASSMRVVIMRPPGSQLPLTPLSLSFSLSLSTTSSNGCARSLMLRTGIYGERSLYHISSELAAARDLGRGN